MGADRCRLAYKRLVDGLFTLIHVDDHRAFVVHDRCIVVGVIDTYLRFTLKTVPLGQTIRLQSEQVHRDNAPAVQDEQSVGGAYETYCGLSISKLILHEFGDWQIGKCLGDHRFEPLIE